MNKESRTLCDKNPITLINMLTIIKKKILGSFWPYGSKARILRGPLKGSRFIISNNSGWSPIVGRWEPESQALFQKVIYKGAVVYDLGANNGIHSLLFSQLAGPAGTVYSFEPLGTNCKEVEINAGLNNAKNIRIVNAAVSDKSGKMTFHLGLHDKQGSIVGIGVESGQDITVDVITLDEFMASGNLSPDFIKIDIEGAESLALVGFENSFDNIRPVLFIELHTPEQDRKVGEFLLRHGYIAFRLGSGKYDETLGITDLEKIEDLSLIYPDPKGIWGTILAIHPSEIKKIKEGRFV